MDLEEFDKKFENFRRASAISNKHICWTCILRFLDKNWHCINLLGSNSGDRVVKFCLDVLMEHDCIDKTFLYTILEFYFRWHFHDCNCEDRGSEVEYMNNIMGPLRVLESSHEKKPFSKVNLGTLPICVTDVKFMLVLSKYGIDTELSVFSLGNAIKSFKRFMLCIPEDEQLRHNSPQMLSQDALRFLAACAENNWTMPFSDNKRGMCYFFLLIRTLHAVSLALEESPFCINFVKCLRVFYRTISKPFVCQKDVKEFLRFLWVLLPFRLISLVRIIEIYLGLFKNDCPQLYAPRSLKHLSRIAVRSSLKKNMKMLPHSVRSLHIPRDLHDYLLCIEPLHIDGIEFKFASSIEVFGADTVLNHSLVGCLLSRYSSHNTVAKIGH